MHTETHTTETSIRLQIDDRDGPQCLDCLFWYRCKKGKVDCELKHI